MAATVVNAMGNSFLDRLEVNRAKAIRYGVWGGAGGAIGEFISEFVGVNRATASSIIDVLLSTTVWFAICGAAITTALIACGLTRMRMASGVVTGGLFGLVAGGIAGFASQFLYTIIGPTEMLRVICWGIAGTLLGIALSWRIPNLLASRGGLGGAIGGALGGIVFIIISFILAEVLGRIVGIGAIGFFIGIMIIFADVAMREAWLEIVFPTGEKDTVTLGRNPVLIGSDDNQCQVFASGAPPVALSYRLDGGVAYCVDMTTGATVTVGDGDERHAGKLVARLRTSNPRANRPPTSPPAYQPPAQTIQPTAFAQAEVRPPTPANPVSYMLNMDVTRIGTAQDCTARLVSAGVMPYHAEVRREGSRLVVCPIGGTTVEVSFGGVPTQFRLVDGRNALKDGSLIRIGGSTMVVRLTPDRLELQP